MPYLNSYPTSPGNIISGICFMLLSLEWVCYTVIDKQNNLQCNEVGTITIFNLEVSNLRLLIVDKIIMTKNIY